MNALQRWTRFNLVGGMGMALQLGAVTVLNRLAPGHGQATSAVAVELAILHNFTAHLRYTWADRRTGHSVLRQLLRFHLSNGLVSLAGNLLLLHLLIHATHLPLVLSNLVAIVCCSGLNFFLSHRWAFAPCQT